MKENEPPPEYKEKIAFILGAILDEFHEKGISREMATDVSIALFTTMCAASLTEEEILKCTEDVKEAVKRIRTS